MTAGTREAVAGTGARDAATIAPASVAGAARRAATGMDAAEWADYLRTAGAPTYRARQIQRHLFRRHTASFAAMSDLPAPLRERLDRDLTAYGLTERSRSVSRDRMTSKLLLQAGDGQLVETVSIYEPRAATGSGPRARHTVCVSSQVGCAMGCVFCASGLQGLARNLTAGEMLDQVAIVQRELGPLTNLVFMGMGEPLANYEALSRALALLCADDGFGFSARRITVSTVGLVPGIERLARLALPVGLAVSLHADDDRLRQRLVPTSGRWPVAEHGGGLVPGIERLARLALPVGLAVSLHADDDRLRQRLVPTSGRWPVAEIAAAAAAYARSTGRAVTFEYVLLAGVNDSAAAARRLAQLLREHCPAPAKVNLIPYNPVPELDQFRPPSSRRVQGFVQVLRAAAVPVTVRKEKGQEVAAACGQLRHRSTMPPTDRQAFAALGDHPVQ